MDKDRLDPELERVITQVKLKEPPQELMNDYLLGINNKIDRGVGKSSGFGFPQAAFLLLVGMTTVGIVYYLLAINSGKELAMENPEPAEAIVNEISASVTSQPNVVTDETMPPAEISLEDQMAILEAFEEDEAAELFDDEELFKELTQLDELEISPAQSAQASGF